MDHSKDTNWNVVLVKASGIALFTVALTWIPKVFSSIMQVISCMIYSGVTSHSNTEFNKYTEQMNATILSSAIGQISGFVVIIFIARCVLKYPRFLRRWLGDEIESANQDAAPNT